MNQTLVITSILGLIVLLLCMSVPIKPFRFIGTLLVKVVVGALLLFGLNIIGTQVNLHVPINLVTSSICGFLGIPGLCALAVIQFYILS